MIPSTKLTLISITTTFLLLLNFIHNLPLPISSAFPGPAIHFTEAWWMFGCWMDKMLLGSKARQELSRPPASCPICTVSINTATNRVEVCGLGAAPAALLPVPQIHPLLCYWSRHQKTNQVKGHSEVGVGSGGGLRALHIFWPGSGSLENRDSHGNANKYTYSHKATLRRSCNKILISISCFSFSFIK